mgnify:CR=1 FL=1
MAKTAKTAINLTERSIMYFLRTQTPSSSFQVVCQQCLKWPDNKGVPYTNAGSIDYCVKECRCGQPLPWRRRGSMLVNPFKIFK